MSFFLTKRFFYLCTALIAGFVAAFFLPWLLGPLQLLLGVAALLTLLDALLLYAPAGGASPVFGRRALGEKLSNGDDNDVQLFLENRYRFGIQVEVIDEIPHQFQRRDVLFEARIQPGQTQIITYQLRPTKRGEYAFGALNVYAASPLRLVRRRFRFGREGQVVPVYPSFLQMRQYELLAIHNRLTEVGVKRIRRVGQSMEFEQIRPYASGDDPRTINWKASARRATGGGSDTLVVNHFQDERAQQVYCLIDKGRVMRMPFAGLSLLDYAINATLVLSNIALLKHDKAGLITFANKPGATVPAERRAGHLRTLLEVLYRQKTQYLETDYELLYATVRARIKQRSLLVLFTNFETLPGLERQLPYLRALSKAHLLLVVFFENTELRTFVEAPAETTADVYNQTIAEKFQQDKRQIVLELQRYGIHALLTPPQQLTANTINKYLEFKARGLI
ncbi:MAG: DUF58 domain-containing protein [Janthinobacterium lividum]